MFLIKRKINLIYTFNFKNLYLLKFKQNFYIYLYFKFIFIIIFNILSIIFLKKDYLFKSFYFFYLKNFLNKFFKLDLYQYEFLLDGLYFRVKYYKRYKIIGFIIGYSNYIFYKLPLNEIYCFVHKKKRRFFLYGFNLPLLSFITKELISLKYPNLFKGKGLKFIEMIYRKKNSKKEKRK